MDSNFRVTAARRAAFDVLRRVETENAYAGNLLTSSRYQGLSREDHALAQELTLGVLRWQGLLDYLIKHHAQRSLDKLDLEVIIALRMGLPLSPGGFDDDVQVLVLRPPSELSLYPRARGIENRGVAFAARAERILHRLAGNALD